MSQRCQNRPLANLFDHMVGTHENSTRKRDPELFGGFHVEGQFQFSWKFDREIGGAGSVQYFVNISRCAMDACIEINSIANEPTGFYVYAISVNSGKARCGSDSGEPCLF
jgi:hypothetical protein